MAETRLYIALVHYTDKSQGTPLFIFEFRCFSHTISNQCITSYIYYLISRKHLISDYHHGRERVPVLRRGAGAEMKSEAKSRTSWSSSCSSINTLLQRETVVERPDKHTDTQTHRYTHTHTQKNHTKYSQSKPGFLSHKRIFCPLMDLKGFLFLQHAGLFLLTSKYF